jgi:hypothetical protein
MSTILKALRRLEQEREAKPERDLRDQVVARPERASWPGSRPRIPLLVVAGAAGAVLVVALVTLLERGGDEKDLVAEPRAHVLAERGASAPPASSAVSRPRPSERARPLPASVPDAAERAAARAARRARVAAVAPPPAAPSALVPAAPPEPAAAAHAPAPAQPVVVSELGRPLRFQTEEAPPAARETGLPAVAAAAAPPPPQANAWVDEPEPLVHERAGIAGQPEVAARTPLVAIVVERTLWHPDPGRRLAVLQVEGRDAAVELREGDAVGDVVVQQIDPSGVLFLHHGVEIRRRVGARD